MGIRWEAAAKNPKYPLTGILNPVWHPWWDTDRVTLCDYKLLMSKSHKTSPFKVVLSFGSLCKNLSSRDMRCIFTAFTLWPGLFRASGMFTKS